MADSCYFTLVRLVGGRSQDAAPVTLGQEFGGYDAQLAVAQSAIRFSLGSVSALAIGGTAVGTGQNTHAEFGARVARLLAERLGVRFIVAPNLFAAMAGHEAWVGLHGALRMLAIALNEIANDIRLMGSGPRAGLGELRLPENEPGSSIMPGKVNPTQVSPHIGYGRAARNAQQAQRQGTTLREAALASGEISAAAFDAWMQPTALAAPSLPETLGIRAHDKAAHRQDFQLPKDGP